MLPHLVLNFKPNNYRKNLVKIITYLIIEFIFIAIYPIYDDILYFDKDDKKDHHEMEEILNLFFGRLKFIKNRNRDKFDFDLKVLFYIKFKILKIFLALVQIKIFKSEEFKYFFFYNRIKNTFSFRKKGLLKSYEFNNYRFNKNKKNHDLIEYKTNHYNFLKQYNNKDYILNENDKQILKNYLEKNDKNKENSENIDNNIKNSNEILENVNTNFESINNKSSNEKLNELEYKKEFELSQFDYNLKNDEEIIYNKKNQIFVENRDVEKYKYIQSLILNSLNKKSTIQNYYKYNIKDLKRAFLDRNIKNFILTNSLKLMQLFIYLNFFLYSVIKSNIIDALYIIIIFSYYAVLFPRANSKFWNFLIYLINANLFIQYLIQLLFKYIQTGEKNIESFFNILNFILFINEEKKYHLQIFYYFWSFYFIFLLTLYRMMLIKNGLWEKIELEYEKIKNIDQRIKDYKNLTDDLSEITTSNIKQKKKIINLFLYIQFELNQEDLFNYKMKEYLKTENKDINLSNTEIYLTFKDKEHSIKAYINNMFEKCEINSSHKEGIKNKLFKYIFYLDFLGNKEYSEMRIEIPYVDNIYKFKKSIKEDIIDKYENRMRKELNELFEIFEDKEELLNKMINILKIIFIKVNFRESNIKSPKLYQNIIRKYQVI